MRFITTALALLVATTAVAATNPPPVLLVRATVSASNPSEKSYAQAIARNLSRRFQETGIPHDMVDDDRLDEGSIQGRSVVVLPYNPYPPAPELAILARHVASGGKLLVFYSASDRLAQFMGLKFSALRLLPARDRWCAIRFNAAAPLGVPELVRQYSRSMRAVEADDPGPKIVAEWEDLAGRPTGDPAWLKCRNGYWMTHIVLDDGDNDAKNRMLLAIMGDMLPSLWPAAVQHRLTEAVSIGSCSNIADVSKAANESAVDPDARRAVAGYIAKASGTQATIDGLIHRGEFAAASAMCPELHRTLLLAYAAAQKPAADRRRGIWDRHGLGLYPGDWDRTCSELARAGINALFVNLLTAGSAHYPSRMLAPTDTFNVYGDQLKAASEAARRHGLEFHVWSICWSLQGSKQDTLLQMARAGKIQANGKSESMNWLCPTHPENIAQEKDKIRELVGLAPFDGLHLDYVRFHDSKACTCAGCRSRFEKKTGRKIRKWPDDALSGALQDDFRAWRMDQISRLVQDVSAIVRSTQSNAVVSAAVYGHYPSATASVGQDWKKWIDNGWLDFVCPMNYTSDTVRFEDYVREQIRLVGPQYVFPGIGVTAAESRLDAAQVTDQIAACRRLGVQGFVLFDLNRIVMDDILPYLPIVRGGPPLLNSP